MGKNKYIKLKDSLKIFFLLIFCFLLISPSNLSLNLNNKQSNYSDQISISKISNQIEIQPGSDHYIKFDSDKLFLEEKTVMPYSKNLNDNVISAIIKSPTWIRQDLTRQFFEIENPDDYAEIILSSPIQYVDEIAFSIAHSPIGKIPSADLLYYNAFLLYENDKWIDYADIVDYNFEDGNYFSTVRYKIFEDGEEKYFEYPYDIYYWYIVHPGTCGEEAKYVYENFWRSYIFNHNDLGYPLLKEKLSNILYLWDNMSYSQPGNRLWSWSIKNHPTAIEAVSYWIGKTIPYEAIGNRPGQPNSIAHGHNGYCGELQRIAVAALRSSLIASVGACNIGEDHVWREFYDRGWHQNDNWWTDSGGNVNMPDTYQYGWGKYMSAVYAPRGDDYIYDVTSTYIHPEDRTTVKFVVRDIFLKPVDGARVTVTVQGIKDVSGIKYSLLEKMDQLWDKIPDILKGKILQAIYDKIYTKIEESDDIVNGLTTTTWNYTDMNGVCTFELGKNHKYLFIIQQGENLRDPWQLARNNVIRIYNNTDDKTFNVLFLDFSRRITKHIDYNVPLGDINFDVSFDSSYYQLQKSVITKGFGMYEHDGVVDCFFVDEENFERYKNNRFFKSVNYLEAVKGNFNIDIENKDWYIVFRNHAKHTSIVVDFDIGVITDFNNDRVCFVTPKTNLFENPSFNIGDMINFSGISTDDLVLKIESEQIEISANDGFWYYLYDSSNLIPGDLVVNVSCNGFFDEITITLYDSFVPNINVSTPTFGEIIGGDSLFISGDSSDNFVVERIEVAIDDGDFFEASGTNNWFIDFDISGLDLGDHEIYAKAIDMNGNNAISKVLFVLNESGHNWSPKINEFYHNPIVPSNISNVIIYANVTSDSPFNVDSVILYFDNGSSIRFFEMFEYANYPIQDRNEEDPLINESNAPIFGFELGQFHTGEIINYWIVCYDTAKNSIVSEEKSFEII